MDAFHDFVVALNYADGSLVAVWKGERYRRYDQQTVYQYQVSMLPGPDEAVQRAQAIWKQLQGK